MYNIENFYNTVDAILSNPKLGSIEDIKETVLAFFNKYPCKERLYSALNEYYRSEYEGDERYVEKACERFESATEKDEYFVRAFLDTLANALADEENDIAYTTVYVIIENLDDNGSGMVKRYEGLSEAIKDIDDTYIGCCDDVYFAEQVWFTLLCDLREKNYDEIVNFSAIFKYDAQNLEAGREAWEAENCN